MWNTVIERALAGTLFMVFILPIACGIVGTLLPAMGWLDLVDRGNGFIALIQDPRLWPAVVNSVQIGLLATVLVLLLTLIALVSAHQSRLWGWITASLPPLLAVPHAAMAVGLLFLIAPSGALVRLLSPELTGWARPPELWVVPDAWGWTLVAGLVIKETPFLLLTAGAQLSTLNVDASLRIGRTLGYSPARCWSRLILPRLYPRIRLTLIIILAFNLTVVDVAMLLGPSNPPTLSVLLLSLVNDPNSRAAASAGALILCAIVALNIALLWCVEQCISIAAKTRRQSGHRGWGLKPARRLGQAIIAGLLVTCISAMVVIIIWSFTRRWRFPNALPSEWTLSNWVSRYDLLFQPAWTTLSLAVTSALFALVSAIAWLELEHRNNAIKLDSVWFIPLLVPQVSLLFGWQAVALLTGTDGLWLMVMYTHWLYSVPYVVLILAVAWRELDPQWSHAAHTLGAGYWRVLWRIRIPLLVKPLCQAFAVAIAVSVAQYLPTVLLGAGRHQTLATELVTSFGGVDRRMIAALAVLQSTLPLVAFVIAITYPKWRTMQLINQSNRANGSGVVA